MDLEKNIDAFNKELKLGELYVYTPYKHISYLIIFTKSLTYFGTHLLIGAKYVFCFDDKSNTLYGYQNSNLSFGVNMLKNEYMRTATQEEKQLFARIIKNIKRRGIKLNQKDNVEDYVDWTIINND